MFRWSRLAVIATLMLAHVPAVAAEPVSFNNEVMAVLSRGGCNQGACHGNQNGKNGFKLSLRGQDPAFDYRSLTRDTLGRRTNALRPDESLLVLKPTAGVAHEGGKRFSVGSLEHRVLRQWIAQGLRNDVATTPRLRRISVTPRERILIEPDDGFPIHVTATFSDGSSRDVTPLAVFETFNDVARVEPDGSVHKEKDGEAAVLVRYLNQQATVRVAFVPARPDFKWPKVTEVNYVDRHLFAKLKKLRLRPSALCSDEVFLRRAHLDVIGLLPTADEARKFLQDKRADKRALLIDELVKRTEFADFWALKWSDVLRNEERTLDRKGVRVFHQWIRKSIAEGQPLNQFAHELLTGRGSTYSHPPANYYRALRDPQIRAETTAQVFLGRRIQCARCHNHPFDQWTQQDYHGMAAFFARINYRVLENNRKDRLDKHEFIGEQVVWLARDGDVTHPVSGEVVSPRLLAERKQPTTKDVDRLKVLADWVASPKNPFFAEAQANRIWFHLMGRGIVHPIDDFKLANPPASAPLLAALADDFKKHNFDLRHLIRVIMKSRTYQLSYVPNETNREDEINFSRVVPRALQSEQLLDALSQVTGAPSQFTGYRLGIRATQLPGVRALRLRDESPSDADKFLTLFGKPPRSLACECERSEDVTLGQAFQMITGRLLNEKLSKRDNRIGAMLKDKWTDAKILDELYLASLSRFPTERERKAASAIQKDTTDRRRALEDVLWSLLSAKEFLLRR